MKCENLNCYKRHYVYVCTYVCMCGSFWHSPWPTNVTVKGAWYFLNSNFFISIRCMQHILAAAMCCIIYSIALSWSLKILLQSIRVFVSISYFSLLKQNSIKAFFVLSVASHTTVLLHVWR